MNILVRAVFFDSWLHYSNTNTRGYAYKLYIFYIFLRHFYLVRLRFIGLLL